MCASPPGGGSARAVQAPLPHHATRLAKISIHSRSNHRARLSLCADARRRFAASATIDIPLVGGEAAKAAAAPVLKVFYWPKMMIRNAPIIRM